METINEWKEIMTSSIIAFAEKVMSVLPDFIGALLILLLGYYITKLVGYLLKKTLNHSKIGLLTKKINEKKLFGNSDFTLDLSNLIIKIAKWLLMLVFIVIAAGIMKWTIISDLIEQLLVYLPKLISAIAVFLVGLYIAVFLKNAIKGIFESFSLDNLKFLSHWVYYIIVVLFTFTALSQAGVKTEIITDNFLIIIAAILLTVVIAIGFGSHEIVKDLLKAYYVRKMFKIGDKLSFNDIVGRLESLDNVSATIKTEKATIIVPIEKLYNGRVEIIPE